jgi:hypothetical protein
LAPPLSPEVLNTPQKTLVHRSAPYSMNAAFKCLVLSLLSTLSLCAGNILENPGFDLGASRWDFFIPESSKSHGNTLTVVDTQGVDGGAAAKLTSTVLSRFGIAQKNIPVTGWTRYRVTFWFKADQGVEYTTGPLVRLNFRASGDNSDTDFYVGLGGQTATDYKLVKRPNWLPTSWEKSEAVVESPINAKALSLCFFSWGIKGAVYFDNLSVEALPSASK